MNILIVEDDIIQSENLKTMLLGIDKSLTVYSSDDKDGALEILRHITVDIFYIDICLKDSSGLDLAVEIRKIYKYEFSWIIFLTSHVEYITQAFKEVHCYDYILKPYDTENLIALSKRIVLRSGNNDLIERKNVVFDLGNSILIKVFLDDILFIEVNSRVCTIHTKKGNYKVKGLSLKQTLILINSSSLTNSILQSHKSFAVNIRHITKIEKLNIKSYQLFFDNYEEIALLSYNFKDTIIANFRNDPSNKVLISEE